MMRHWNDIAGTLFKGEVYVPLLLEDENGTAHGNDWAPRLNIAPTQRVPVIRQNPKEPVRELSLVRWGTHSIMGERLVRRRQDDQRKIGKQRSRINHVANDDEECSAPVGTRPDSGRPLLLVRPERLRDPCRSE
jgi:putative SOS response-associated peptidase YedK